MKDQKNYFLTHIKKDMKEQIEKIIKQICLHWISADEDEIKRIASELEDELNKIKQDLKTGENLFNALQEVCDFPVLEIDMFEIVKAVELDNK